MTTYSSLPLYTKFEILTTVENPEFLVLCREDKETHALCAGTSQLSERLYRERSERFIAQDILAFKTGENMTWKQFYIRVFKLINFYKSNTRDEVQKQLRTFAENGDLFEMKILANLPNPILPSMVDIEHSIAYSNGHLNVMKYFATLPPPKGPIIPEGDLMPMISPEKNLEVWKYLVQIGALLDTNLIYDIAKYNQPLLLKYLVEERNIPLHPNIIAIITDRGGLDNIKYIVSTFPNDNNLTQRIQQILDIATIHAYSDIVQFLVSTYSIFPHVQSMGQIYASSRDQYDTSDFARRCKQIMNYLYTVPGFREYLLQNNVRLPEL